MSWECLGRSKGKGGLGYRTWSVFKLALLAKQGWKLLQNPHSLVARVLKEKYYPGVSFFEYELVNKLSYAWRSIWVGKKLLHNPPYQFISLTT
jgi:hypothetical protein